MKKTVALLSSVLMMGSLLSGCKGNTPSGSVAGSTSGKKTNIRLQLTPSRPSDDLTATTAALKPVLEKYDTMHTYSISTGTNFATDGTALAAGTIDASFITASVFATTSIAKKDKIDMLLRATRSSFKVVQENYDASESDNAKKYTNENARKLQAEKMNDLSYGYHGEAQGTASYYYAECIINRANITKFDTNGDGKIDLFELAGHNVALQGAGSPAGYSYPLYAFHNETNGGKWADGMKKVEANADATKGEFVAVSGLNYATALQKLMANDGSVDAVWSYMDFRNDNAGKFDESKNDPQWLYKNTYTVALTQGILNDGLAVRADLPEADKKAIADAFMAIMQSGDPRDNGEGTEADKDSNGCYDVNGDGKASDANAVFRLYSHTGYEAAKNSDYDDEIEFQKWAANNL